MPITPFLRGEAFQPETLANMSAAFEKVCATMGLTTQPDAATNLIARKIIEYAQRGIQDVAALVDAVKNDFDAGK